MKATLSLMTLMIIVIGFALVGDALAQPDNPSPAATETSGDGSAADEAAKPEEPKTEDPKPDEAKPTEAEGAPSDEAKEEAKKETEAGATEDPVDQAKGLFASLKGGKWMLAFGFFAMLIGSILRWGLKMKWAFWESKAGGYTVAGIMGLATLGTDIVMSGSLTMNGFVAAATVALTAMGLHGPTKALKEKVKPS